MWSLSPSERLEPLKFGNFKEIRITDAEIAESNCE